VKKAIVRQRADVTSIREWVDVAPLSILSSFRRIKQDEECELCVEDPYYIPRHRFGSEFKTLCQHRAVLKLLNRIFNEITMELYF
jgi:hypothetical protein